MWYSVMDIGADQKKKIGELNLDSIPAWCILFVLTLWNRHEPIFLDLLNVVVS